jgi:predicted RNA methylase
MLLTAAAAGEPAATLPLFLPQSPTDKVSGLIHAATLLSQLLGQGRALDTRALRSAMETAFAASDADGAWVWKDAYEALEAAQVLFLRKYGAAMRARAGSRAAMLEMLTRLAERLPSQTRRSEESEKLQQFSTPITLGFVAAEAAALTASDLVLEPSAGTGLLAIFAELAKAHLALNEIAETRAGLLARLFRDGNAPVSRHNAEQIHDRLDAAIRPSVVLMNPPFSASPNIEGRFAEAAFRHVTSALARLAEGGRLVAITGHNVGPEQPAWRESFVRLQEKGASCSPRRWPARPMRATARPSTPGSPSSTAFRRRTRARFRRRREWPRPPPTFWSGSRGLCRRGRRSLSPALRSWRGLTRLCRNRQRRAPLLQRSSHSPNPPHGSPSRCGPVSQMSSSLLTRPATGNRRPMRA